MPFLDPKSAKAFGRVGGLGLELAAFLLIGVKGGEWLDRRFGTAPVLQRAGLLFGIFAGFYSLWKLTRVSSRGPSDPSSSGEPTTGESDATGKDRPNSSDSDVHR
ncbi:MAG: AtpZ/AtpI family protein [Sandaracinus sp.]|nr:AtpZ/AtpI family protein [Sandaracinus sp.]MCB9632348.1 AtpZ/AtpI family protein [Sandaracinus sp.]